MFEKKYSSFKHKRQYLKLWMYVALLCTYIVKMSTKLHSPWRHAIIVHWTVYLQVLENATIEGLHIPRYISTSFQAMYFLLLTMYSSFFIDIVLAKRSNHYSNGCNFYSYFCVNNCNFTRFAVWRKKYYICTFQHHMCTWIQIKSGEFESFMLYPGFSLLLFFFFCI